MPTVNFKSVEIVNARYSASILVSKLYRVKGHMHAFKEAHEWDASSVRQSISADIPGPLAKLVGRASGPWEGRLC
jgi:hypothetical protein